MAIVKTFDELELRLLQYVRSWKGRTAIMSGHYPLNSLGEPCLGDLADDGFGYFSQATFDLAASLVSRGREVRRENKIVLVVDDHSKQGNPLWYHHTPETLPDTMIKSVGRIQDYFQEGKVPAEYARTVTSCGLDESVFVTSQTSGNALFAESAYRRKAMDLSGGQDFGCSGDYRTIVEEIAANGFDNMVSLIPLRCQSATCSGINFAYQNGMKMRMVHAYLKSDPESKTVDDLIPENGIIIDRWR